MSPVASWGTPFGVEVVQHLGALHGYEKVLVGLLAFGPFAVMGLVVYVVRRRDLEEERRGEGALGTGGEPPREHLDDRPEGG